MCSSRNFVGTVFHGNLLSNRSIFLFSAIVDLLYTGWYKCDNHTHTIQVQRHVSSQIESLIRELTNCNQNYTYNTTLWKISFQNENHMYIEWGIGTDLWPMISSARINIFDELRSSTLLIQKHNKTHFHDWTHRDPRRHILRSLFSLKMNLSSWIGIVSLRWISRWATYVVVLITVVTRHRGGQPEDISFSNLERLRPFLPQIVDIFLSNVEISL